MPGRSYTQENQYRYGFNGKELDPEGMGGGLTTYDYGFRIYNPSIAKFLSVDPLAVKFPWYTPYHFSGNKPISCLDLDGAEDIYYLDSFIQKNGKLIVWLLTNTDIGKSLVQELQNTDPNKFDGRVNLGYDTFVMRKTYTNAGNVTTHGTTKVMYHPGFNIRDTDEVGNPIIRFDGKEAVLNALKNKNGEIYERLRANYPIELLESADFKESLASGRGIIIIGITTHSETLNAIEEYENALKDAETLGHEVNHASDESQGDMCTMEEDHEEMTGSATVTTFVLPGSKQDILNNQLRDVLPKFLSILIRHL